MHGWPQPCRQGSAEPAEDTSRARTRDSFTRMIVIDLMSAADRLAVSDSHARQGPGIVTYSGNSPTDPTFGVVLARSTPTSLLPV